MDIDKLYTRETSEAGAWCDITDPLGAATGLKFKIAGAHSDRFRRAMTKAQAKQMNREKARGRRDVTPEDLELEFDLMADVLAECTLEWNAEKDEKDWPCSFENAQSVYINAPDVRRQVFQFASDARNYFLSQSSAGAPANE